MARFTSSDVIQAALVRLGPNHKYSALDHGGNVGEFLRFNAGYVPGPKGTPRWVSIGRFNVRDYRRYVAIHETFTDAVDSLLRLALEGAPALMQSNANAQIESRVNALEETSKTMLSLLQDMNARLGAPKQPEPDISEAETLPAADITSESDFDQPVVPPKPKKQPKPKPKMQLLHPSECEAELAFCKERGIHIRKGARGRIPIIFRDMIRRRMDEAGIPIR